MTCTQAEYLVTTSIARGAVLSRASYAGSRARLATAYNLNFGPACSIDLEACLPYEVVFSRSDLGDSAGVCRGSNLRFSAMCVGESTFIAALSTRPTASVRSSSRHCTSADVDQCFKLPAKMQAVCMHSYCTGFADCDSSRLNCCWTGTTVSRW